MRVPIVLLFSAFTLAAQSVSASQPGAENHSLRDPRRDPWQKPDQVISALSFSPSEIVAVIENGYPYFAPRVAPLVKRAYAVNTDLRAFEGRGQLPPGASPIVADNGDPKIVGLHVDTVIMVDVLRFLPQRSLYYLAIVAGLKPGGRLVIIDRIVPATLPASEQVTDVVLQTELSLLGFGLSQKFTFLPYQYFIVFHR